MPSFQLIHYPYPFEASLLEKSKTILYLSFFLCIILFFLQPFGFVPVRQMEVFCVNLLVGTVVILVNFLGLPLLLPKWFEENNWTVLKAILFFSYNFLLVGLWYHIYQGWIVRASMVYLVDISEIAKIVFRIVLLGWAAMGFLVLIRYNILTRQNLEASQNLNERLKSQLQIHSPSTTDRLITLHLEGKDLPFERHQLRFIHADGNYITIQTLAQNEVTSTLYREPIKNVENQLRPYLEFFRCHRSHIINVKFIQETKGNSRGLTLTVNGIDQSIPVSRARIKSLLNHLELIAGIPSHS